MKSTANTTTVRIEFFGIPRARAGCSELNVEVPADGIRYSELLGELSRLLPEFARVCINEGALRKTFAANLNGTSFIHAAATVIRPGESLLILSADAGG